LIRSGPRVVADGDYTLREITPADAQRLYDWRMEASARAMFKTTDLIPYETHQRFINRYFDPSSDERWFMLEHLGSPVATLALYDISSDGSCEWGRHLVPVELRGRGYGEKVFEMMIKYARLAGFRKIRAEVLASNERALRCYPKFGFKTEKQYEEQGREYRQLLLELS
jgi:RimJ/RimL family protein N-acetyltransferase